MLKVTLQRSTPEDQGVASTAIIAFIEGVQKAMTKGNNQDLHSFMLLRHGVVISEGWWSPYKREMPHMLFSLSKSFTSTAIGLAISEGLLTVEDLVVSYFKAECAAPVSEYLAALRIKHLLTMSTGQERDTIDDIFNCQDGDWVGAFLKVPFDQEPGSSFLYNTGATYILSVILQKITGQKLIDYLQPRIFEPLGIVNPKWETCPKGYNTGGFGLSITTEDIAKFGQLYLQKGVWEGIQIIPSAWVEEATKKHIDNGTDMKSDWSQGYGYQFWRSQNNGYRGDGAFGQFCVVLPELDVVLAITGGVKDMQIPLTLVWDLLLPGIKDGILPENLQVQSLLKEKLASLEVLLPAGKHYVTGASEISGRRYQLEANSLGIEMMSISFGKDQCLISIKQEASMDVVSCGIGMWLEGYYTKMGEKVRAFSSGIWSDDKTFTLVSRYVETPFSEKTTFTFEGHAVQIAIKTNVAFGPIETISIKGNRVI